ncbi:MAG: arylsulfatase [Verrucomicrobia bacterium]|nr:arylsulfatase [Verrucomicrobiota bacterium]
MKLPLILTGALLALVNLVTPSSAAERKPNIILLIADDLGYGDIGCYGQKKIRTPNLDRMAAEGMRFTQAYSGNAVCAPSRCVLMTGLHPGHAYVRDNRSVKPEGQEPIPAETITISKLLKAQGYATGAFGKWGLGPFGSSGDPLKQGLDRFYGYNCQGKAHNFYPTTLWDNDRQVTLDNPEIDAHANKLPAGADPNNPASYKQFTGKQYSADLIAEQARRFIRDNKDRPFFLFFPTTVPHLALQVPEDSLAEYLGKWPDPPYAGGRGYLPHFAPRAAYAAMITRMDREIGRMMDLVKELGLDDNTIFLFSSDNGPLNGTHAGLAGTDAEFFNSAGGLRDGKGTLWEGGYREPFIARWRDRIAAGKTCERVIGFEDMLPTLVELAGAKDATPKSVDGISFAPTLLGQKQEARPFLYREFPGYGGQQCVRVGDWKAIRQNMLPRGRGKAKGKKAQPNMRIQLYNLKDDVAETKDVAAQHPDVVAKLEKIMREQHTPSSVFPFPALDEDKTK